MTRLVSISTPILHGFRVLFSGCPAASQQDEASRATPSGSLRFCDMPKWASHGMPILATVSAELATAAEWLIPIAYRADGSWQPGAACQDPYSSSLQLPQSGEGLVMFSTSPSGLHGHEVLITHSNDSYSAGQLLDVGLLCYRTGQLSDILAYTSPK